MTDTVKITLANPLTGHGDLIREVVLRAPSYDDYLDLGEPVTLARAPDDTLFQVENTAVIRQYIERCLVAPTDPILLESGGFRLARQMKDGVLGFFRGESSAAAASKTSPTTSSSPPATAASTPAPSAA